MKWKFLRDIYLRQLNQIREAEKNVEKINFPLVERNLKSSSYRDIEYNRKGTDIYIKAFSQPFDFVS